MNEDDDVRKIVAGIVVLAVTAIVAFSGLFPNMERFAKVVFFIMAFLAVIFGVPFLIGMLYDRGHVKWFVFFAALWIAVILLLAWE